MQDGANLSEWGLKPFIYKERASLTAYRKEFKHKSELETKGKFILKAITLHRQESGLLSKLENEPLSIPGTGFKSVFLSGVGNWKQRKRIKEPNQERYLIQLHYFYYDTIISPCYLARNCKILDTSLGKWDILSYHLLGRRGYIFNQTKKGISTNHINI